MLKAVLNVNNLAHQKQHVTWMQEGFARHGIEAEVTQYNHPKDADFAVIWGWKQPRVIEHYRERGKPILVMERGHLHPRMEFTSLGWNGLGNRGRYPDAGDGGERWRKHWGRVGTAHMEPWKDAGRWALVIGQVEGDASLYGVNFNEWAQTQADKLRGLGLSVRYRPHPLMLRNGRTWCPAGAEFSTEVLSFDLAGACLCVTYNSTTGVEAALAGVPTVTCDEGAMAWPVTSHDVEAAPVTPDRTTWAHRLAWCQWNEAEIRSGEAWAAVREGI